MRAPRDLWLAMRASRPIRVVNSLRRAKHAVAWLGELGERKTQMTKYAVYWDNGNSACGTFKERFDTWEEAEQWADNWARERNLEDLGMNDAEVEECGGEGCYTAEAIELEEDDELDPEAAPDNPRPEWA